MKENKNKETMDKNFFKAMNYELAGEIGVIDNEDMKDNKHLNSRSKTYSLNSIKVRKNRKG